MFEVTPEARTALHQLLERTLSERPQADERLGFRLVAGEGGRAELGLALDAPCPGDEVVEHAGRSVLIVDPPTSDLLGDLTLDVIESRAGRRLALRE